MRYLGIDFGSRKVGLALSDEAGTMGFPHAIVPNDGRLIDEVTRIIAEKNVDHVVMGDSRDFSGKDNPVAHAARAFAQLLEQRTGRTVDFEPEALTTQEASRTIEGERRGDLGHVDAAAAALILTSYLSHHGKN
ncbi:MAG: Resolvase, holliday junction-type, YqgF-like protein [Parcubacteria bacterium C7867-001]|nr:MAG: Resolvase, holliday junction-type, YqgF-like protein [Parcubacteria bacterium C7867-001]